MFPVPHRGLLYLISLYCIAEGMAKLCLIPSQGTNFSNGSAEFDAQRKVVSVPSLYGGLISLTDAEIDLDALDNGFRPLTGD